MFPLGCNQRFYTDTTSPPKCTLALTLAIIWGNPNQCSPYVEGQSD